jgi:hypothetical protein
MRSATLVYYKDVNVSRNMKKTVSTARSYKTAASQIRTRYGRRRSSVITCLTRSTHTNVQPPTQLLERSNTGLILFCGATRSRLSRSLFGPRPRKRFLYDSLCGYLQCSSTVPSSPSPAGMLGYRGRAITIPQVVVFVFSGPPSVGEASTLERFPVYAWSKTIPE